MFGRQCCIDRRSVIGRATGHVTSRWCTVRRSVSSVFLVFATTCTSVERTTAPSRGRSAIVYDSASSVRHLCCYSLSTLLPETGDFVSGNRRFCCRNRIQSLLLLEQEWTGLYSLSATGNKVAVSGDKLSPFSATFFARRGQAFKMPVRYCTVLYLA